MSKNATFRDKGRAAFLAALMVMSVFAMAASFSGAVAADDGPDVELTAGEIDEDDVWIGQEVEISGLESPADLKQGDDTVENLRVNDGTATLDTSKLDDGRYYIEHGDKSVDDTGTFWVNEHEIESEFENTIVNQDNVTLKYEDVSDVERDGPVNVYVSGEFENETLDEDDLAAIFSDGDAQEDEDTVLIEDLDVEDTIDADFNGEDVGDYEFSIEVADTTAEDTAEIEVTDTEASASFNDSTYEQNVGDVAEFTVEHEAANDLTINVTDEEEFYTAEIELSDISDTEEVTVEFNTYEAGTDAADENVVTAVDEDGNEVSVAITEYLDGDEIDGESAFDDDTRLIAGDYELEVFPDDKEETDAAVLLLSDRSTGDMVTAVLPGDEFNAENVELNDIEESATERDYVADEDLLVVGVEASGIYGYALDNNGDWEGDDSLELEFEDTNEPRYGEADSFNLSEDLSSDVVVVNDDENQFFVIVDATAEDLDVDETWDVTFTVDDSNPYVDDDKDETTDAQFDVEEAYVELLGDQDDDDRFEIETSEEAELSAETNIAPGTEGDFRLRATSEIYNGNAEVNEDGVISATFDLSAHEAGEELRTVRATVGDFEDDAEGIFVASDDDEAEEANFGVDGDAPSSVEVDEDATLDVTVTNDGDEAGNATLDVTVGNDEYTEELELEGGESETFSHDFDTNAEGEIEWSVETDDDSDSGTLTVEEEGEPSEPVDDKDDSDDDGVSDDSDDGEGDDSTPGFGVAVALFALLAAAMLALRREN